MSFQNKCGKNWGRLTLVHDCTWGPKKVIFDVSISDSKRASLNCNLLTTGSPDILTFIDQIYPRAATLCAKMMKKVKVEIFLILKVLCKTTIAWLNYFEEAGNIKPQKSGL